MPSAAEVVTVLDRLQSELERLLRQDLSGIGEERLKRWYERAHEQLTAWNLRDDADRFRRADYKYVDKDTNDQNLRRQSEARGQVLKVLSEELAAHPEFYSKRLAPKLIKARRSPAGSKSEPERMDHAKPAGLKKLELTPEKTETVFLGHGRSPLFAKVQIHLENERRVKVEAFESQSRAGQSVADILKGFLNSCTFAVLVVTGEDETAEGSLRARQNVVHEIGLFQGCLGFEKVALLEQEGIEPFSNIAGLQTIRFGGQKIESAFYELERMLKREGVIR